MEGANEYCKLFSKEEQFGKIVVVPGFHARGPTFHIYILPDGISIASDGWRTGGDSVKVFGIIGGHPGWTEKYGWLHEGPWEKDFAIVCHARRLQLEKQGAIGEKLLAGQKNDEAERIQNLLGQY